jgi:two-component system LytT family sensor kinase
MKKAIQLFFKILILGIVISGVISGWAWGFEALNGRDFIINPAFAKEILAYMIYGIVLTTVNVLFFNYFNNEVDWSNSKWRKYRIFLGFLLSLSLSFIAVFLIRFVTVVGFEQKDFQYFISHENPAHYYVSLFITFIIVVIFHAFYFYKQTQETKLKEQKIIAGTASAKFESLKNQIDPHFLFNSLNVLSSLIEENPETAQDFTTSLSKIYRYVLEQKDKELVPIEEELDFAKTYMNLLLMRFENSLTFEIPEDIAISEAKVVPLSLQLLLENTIKHNVVSSTKPLHIRIYTESGNLVIENNLQKKESLNNRKGVGLQNIINRYAILTKKEVIIKETNTHFIVQLPILTRQLEIMETQHFNQENAYLKAKKRVKELKDFYGHLTSFCLVMPFLIFLNLYTYSEFQWFWFPLLGWGMGLSFHAFEIFGYGKTWEEKKIREFMEKEKNPTKKWE